MQKITENPELPGCEVKGLGNIWLLLVQSLYFAPPAAFKLPPRIPDGISQAPFIRAKLRPRANPFAAECKEEHWRELTWGGFHCKGVGFHHWKYFSKEM